MVFRAGLCGPGFGLALGQVLMDLKLYTILLVWLQGRSLCTTFVAGNFNSFGPGFRAGLCAPPFVGDFQVFWSGFRAGPYGNDIII